MYLLQKNRWYFNHSFGYVEHFKMEREMVVFHGRAHMPHTKATVSNGFSPHLCPGARLCCPVTLRGGGLGLTRIGVCLVGGVSQTSDTWVWDKGTRAPRCVSSQHAPADPVQLPRSRETGLLQGRVVVAETTWAWFFHSLSHPSCSVH